jgi:hypothetical protein
MYFSKAKLYIRERERDGAPKPNVLTSGSPVAHPKSGSDYSVLITIYIYVYFNFLENIAVGIRHADHVAPFIRKS